MEDWHGFINTKSSTGFGVRSSILPTIGNSEDFEEEDVLWNINNAQYGHEEDQYSGPTKMNKLMVSSGSSSSSSSSSAWKVSNTTTPRKIPRRAHHNSNNTQTTSTITNEPKVVQVQQSSAPMKIPDWSKIYGKTNMASWENNHGNHVSCDDHDHDYQDDDDDDDDDDDMVPPHEWIARKLARSQISSFSVCEGIGRTLKGRDLSKVRNAILTKTGFLE